MVKGDHSGCGLHGQYCFISFLTSKSNTVKCVLALLTYRMGDPIILRQITDVQKYAGQHNTKGPCSEQLPCEESIQ